MQPAHLKARHKLTLASIFRHSATHNLQWTEVVDLLNHIGDVAKKHNGALTVTIAGQQTTMLPPHGKDVEAQQIVRLREFLQGAGLAPANDEHPSAVEAPPAIRQMVVVIDHTSARLFHLESGLADDASPVVVEPADPHGFRRHLAHRKEANYQGERVPEDPDFYERIAGALAAAQEILIVSRGAGKSNAGAHLLEHLDKRHLETAGRVVASITADLSHITDGEILVLARTHFEEPPARESQPQP